ncbi:Peptidylprolyl isomerase, partial [Durusdinium trenchii]
HAYPEQEELFTWIGMALAAGGPPLPVGSFVLISRPPDWDEVLVCGFGDSNRVALCRTTSTDGSDWVWVLVQLLGLHLRLPVVGAHGLRTAPAGIDNNDVNWICTPPAGLNQWQPTAAELANLATEANLVLAQVTPGSPGWVLNAPGVGGPNAGGATSSGCANCQPGPEEEEVWHRSGLAGLRSSCPEFASDGIESRKTFRSFPWQQQEEDPQEQAGIPEEEEKEEGKEVLEQQFERLEFKQPFKVQALRWKESGKDRSVPYASLTHIDGLKFKKKGDLVAFATKNPVALTAHFLAGVYQRLSKGQLSRSGQLRDVSVTAWAHQFAGLSEPRDIKEVVTLAEVLDAVNRRELAQALDIISQRILAIQQARQKGGSWEKSEQIELIDARKTLASHSMLALTNA